ncbi:hypothetical protein ZZ1p0055 [Acinetobacter phage ZZ1]|uniref:Uncharacterized protein n=1 Tax=Acinetobacter phage ZZ1 TaxID=1049283 RepID=I3WVP7_9CAUD|nr:hypothetical protein ZZ1p0055 [Acinetobacter phage ZZ1]AFL47567.1 hypothetical protein ZZ1p0055 [Acinetobacter phage ZZ1]
MKMLIDRNKIDVIVGTFCEEMGVVYTTLHEEAFCVQDEKGSWAYIWIDEEGEQVSRVISFIENLIKNDKVMLVSKVNEDAN